MFQPLSNLSQNAGIHKSPSHLPHSGGPSFFFHLQNLCSSLGSGFLALTLPLWDFCLFCFSFLFFETESHYIALTVLELTM